MLIGTAGHIDHGKTSLIKRLTGRNTDRLPEEIKRGISIELGYAYVPVAGSDGVLGFIDVPGHEKFVHTMLAGATGIDLALLVIAADDGVMPQTEEHYDILRLLGVDRGAIAITKTDAVDAARVGEVRAQIARWLQGGPAAAWPVFALSAVTGDGVAELDAWLRAQAASPVPTRDRGHFRLAVDRVFTLAGVGTIVTGTAHAGVVKVGDDVVLAPSGRRARVRSLHAQDRAADIGRAGERIALNLVGIAKDEVTRGDWVQAAALDNQTDRFDASLRLAGETPRGLAQGLSVHLHHGTRDVLARITTLTDSAGELLVTVSTDSPLALCKDDRFVIRDAQARRTLGGGRVLDIAPPTRGKRKPERLALLGSLAHQAPQAAASAWLALQPLPLSRWASGWNLRDDEVQALVTAVNARVAADIAFATVTWQALRDKTLAAVAATHEQEPEMPGLEQNRLRRMVAPQWPLEALTALLDELLADQSLVRRGAFLALPTHKAELAKDERVRWERIKPRLMEQRFDPPRVRDIAKATGMAEGEVRSLLKRVARVGEVTLVAHDHFFLTEAVRLMADIAGELAVTHGAARAAEFRDRIGTGRKVAIQILEFFDRVGYLRRVRDDHLLRRDNPWRAANSASAAVAASP